MCSGVLGACVLTPGLLQCRVCVTMFKGARCTEIWQSQPWRSCRLEDNLLQLACSTLEGHAGFGAWSERWGPYCIL